MRNCPNGLNRPARSGKPENRRIRFSNKKFAESLGAIGLPRTIGEAGDFIRRDHLLSEEPAVAVWQYLASNLFSKFQDPGDSTDLTFEAAIEKFRLAESICFDTNQRFSPAYRYHNEWHCYIHVAREILRDLLKVSGDDPLVSLWKEAEPFFGFGPGATTRLNRRRSDKAYKYSGIPETTPNNANLAAIAIATVPPWRQGSCFAGEGLVNLTIVDGNRITTVPKNYKTDRCIAIEPDMNMYIQKGIGGFLRRRLKSVGIDLNDQTLNQKLACEGSVTGRLACIDLSMASDTVAFGLVKTLFPGYLVTAIENCRSDKGVLPDGEIIRYQKVSSMGNGTTFELESCIFYALAKAVTLVHQSEDGRVSVYGDDIIVASDIADKLIELLAYCGFAVNKDKTFIRGHFRESCGKHYLCGHDISPFFIRRPVDSVEELFLVHNNLRRWSWQACELLSETQLAKIDKILAELRLLAPLNVRDVFIPEGFGDNAFLGNPPDIVLRVNKNGWDGYTLKHFPPAPPEVDYVDVEGLLTKSLSRLETSDGKASGFEIHPIRSLTRRKKQSLYVELSKYREWSAKMLCVFPLGILGENHDFIVEMCGLIASLPLEGADDLCDTFTQSASSRSSS